MNQVNNERKIISILKFLLDFKAHFKYTVETFKN